MKKQFFYNFLVVVILSTCFYLNANAQSVQVEAKLDQQTIRIGDQTQLHLIVQQQVKDHINFPKLADTIISKLQVISSKLDTVIDQNDHSRETVTQTYTITSFDAGTYTIPAYSFGAASGVLKTNEITLQVTTIKVDTTKAIYDIKQPITVSYTIIDWARDNWMWIAIGVAVVLGIIGLIWYLRKRPKVVPAVKEVKIIIPAHQLALSKLQELRDKKLWQQDAIKEYHSELSDVMREYLEKRYVIKTHEKTTDEIFAALRYMDISDENRNKLRQMLVLADLVKFAKEKPLPAENEQSIDNAFNFVLSTQLAEPPKTEGGIADGHI
jgi:hypothetical protein